MISYKIKEEIISNLASIYSGRPSEKSFDELSKNYGIRKEYIKRYWNTFLLEGKPDIKTTHGRYVGRKQKITKARKSQLNALATIKNKGDSQDFSEVFLQYLLSQKNLTDCLLDKKKIKLEDFYIIRKKFETSGKIFDKKVLDPTKYMKDWNFREIFKYSRTSLEEEDKLSKITALRYNNLIKVLIQYLSKESKLSIRVLKSKYAKNPQTIGQEILKNLNLK